MVHRVCVLFRANDPSHSTADFPASLRKTKFDETGNPGLPPAKARNRLRRDTPGPAVGVSPAKGHPVAGKAKVTHKWNGATWRFSSVANRKRFAAAPEKYAPLYGGYCVWAVSQGYTASTDPDA